MFLDGSDNIEKTFEKFKYYAVEAQVNYNQHLKAEKIVKYLKIIKDSQGKKACQDFYTYTLIIHGKYIQMMCLFFIFDDDREKIRFLFESFNENFRILNYSFMKIYLGRIDSQI